MLVPETDRKCPLSTRRQVTFLSFRNRSRRPSKSKPAVGRHIRNMLRIVRRKNTTVRLQFFKPRIIRGLRTDSPPQLPSNRRNIRATSAADSPAFSPLHTVKCVSQSCNGRPPQKSIHPPPPLNRVLKILKQYPTRRNNYFFPLKRDTPPYLTLKHSII